MKPTLPGLVPEVKKHLKCNCNNANNKHFALGHCLVRICKKFMCLNVKKCYWTEKMERYGHFVTAAITSNEIQL